MDQGAAARRGRKSEEQQPAQDAGRSASNKPLLKRVYDAISRTAVDNH